MSLMDAMDLDTMIGIYLACALIVVLAIVYQMVEMIWYAYWRRRARRMSARVLAIQLRQRRWRRQHRVSLLALVLINIANRIGEWRERYRTWRYGDTTVGDRLVDRMEKL